MSRSSRPRSATGVRNRALITVLYRGGLRLGEALELGNRHLDLDSGVLRVVNAATSRARFVRMDPLSFDVLGRWLDRRHAIGLGAKSPIFCTLSGDRLKQAYVRSLLPRLARRAGIEKRCHAHALRHTHAAELASRQLPIEEIQLQLGHASRASTIRYIGDAQPASPGEDSRYQRWVGVG